MKIYDFGKVTHGVTISRVLAKPGEECKSFELFTMQDLSYEIGNYVLDTERQIIDVNIKKYDEKLLSVKDMIIVGLTSYKAFVINENHMNKIVPSNFAIIELDKDKVDPFYFTWYFNEHPSIQKQLTIAMQGSIIRALSVQMLRELEIQLPNSKTQKNIGNIYKLKKLKEKKAFQRNILEDILLKELIVKNLREDKNVNK